MGGREPFDWREARWESGPTVTRTATECQSVVLIDYGVKRNILRSLVSSGLAVTVVPGDGVAADILALNPDGVVLSNGPGDPAATGEYALPVIRDLIAADLPMLGICLGHQMLALALGGEDGEDGSGPSRREPSRQGSHHGQGRDREHESRLRGRPGSLPDTVEETHVSLFDGSNCGIRLIGKPRLFRPAPPRSQPRPAGQPLSVRTVCGCAEMIRQSRKNRLAIDFSGSAASLASGKPA